VDHGKIACQDALEIAPITLGAQLSDMIGEKRTGVSIKNQGERGSLFEQARQLIERYS
jgi:hypothetical protein